MAADRQLKDSLKELRDSKSVLDAHAIVEEKASWLASFPERNPNPIVEFDFNSGFVRYQNPAAARLFPDLQHLRLDHPYLEGIQEEAAALRDGSRQMLQREVNVSGRHYTQTIVYGLENQRLCVYGLDITERKRAEDEIKALNGELEARVLRRTAELEAASKELEAFSYSVSHDLRAPLRAINGFADILLEDYARQLPEEAKRYLERVRQGGQRMRELIDDLLAFARLNRQPLERRPAETARLVREVWEELKPPAASRQIEIRFGELPPCQGDLELLKQVWFNLVSNAIKYSRDRAPAVIETGSKSVNDETVFFVRDNGVGFDMQHAGKLFGVFQRLHRADEFEGTGVGLAIVQRIVHRHGGRVWAHAEAGHGAEFYFTLGGEKL